MLTKTQIEEIQKSARDDAQQTFDDTSDYARTPWVDSDPNPDDSVISAEGIGWICETFDLADWETDGDEFCEVYNAAFIEHWDSLCK